MSQQRRLRGPKRPSVDVATPGYATVFLLSRTTGQVSNLSRSILANASRYADGVARLPLR